MNYLELQGKWGMFTKAGDMSITRKLNILIQKLNKPEITFIEKQIEFEKFFKKFARMAIFKSYTEADDTDVRDQVWGVSFEIAKKHGINYEILNKLWEHRYD